MLVRVRMCGWSGLARRSALSGALSLSLIGCAGMPADWPVYSALDFWEASAQGGTAERDALWDAAQAQDMQWRIALLQSLPDYHRYDPRAARLGLEAAISVNPYDDVAAVARIRLADLRYVRACHARRVELEERLSKVIAIERSLEEDAGAR